jgi:hypothetical protein
VEGSDVSVVARRLTGNDGESDITISHPWIFGSFPVLSSRKLVTDQLRVKAPGLSFDYSETNANDALFEFLPSEVK